MISYDNMTDSIGHGDDIKYKIGKLLIVTT